MLKTLSTASTLCLLLIGSAQADPVSYDYEFRFTGIVTSVEISDRPQVTEPPFLALGDPVHATVGINWISEPSFTDYHVNGSSVGYPIEAINASGSNAAFWFVTTPAFGGHELTFGIEPGTGGFGFNFRTGEVLGVSGSGYGGDWAEVWAVHWGLEGGRIVQVAGGYQAENSHYFTYEGSWEATRMPAISPVPEPAMALLLIVGAVVSRRAQPRALAATMRARSADQRVPGLARSLGPPGTKVRVSRCSSASG